MPTTNIRRRIGGTIHYRSSAEGEPPSRRVEGYALLFGVESAPFVDTRSRRVVEIIEPEAVDMDLLNASDIKMTFDHDSRRLLARSINGVGSLSYHVDERGVAFSFDAPETADGDMVLELVRRGDLRGCSFCFATDYEDMNHVGIERSIDETGKENVTIHLIKLTAIYDFAITPDPAYPATTVEARSLPDVVSARLEASEPESDNSVTEEAKVCHSASLRRLRRLNKRII